LNTNVPVSTKPGQLHLYALQATVPHLTRSSLHRCFQRHGISRLPETQGDKPAKRKFKFYPIAYFHLDIAQVRTEEGKLYLFVAIDRTSKFAYAELHVKANRRTATDFLKALIKAVPYKIHTVLTDNGIQFTDLRGALRGNLSALCRRGSSCPPSPAGDIRAARRAYGDR
jgi:hypothetical protein